MNHVELFAIRRVNDDFYENVEYWDFYLHEWANAMSYYTLTPRVDDIDDVLDDIAASNVEILTVSTKFMQSSTVEEWSNF